GEGGILRDSCIIDRGKFYEGLPEEKKIELKFRAMLSDALVSDLPRLVSEFETAMQRENPEVFKEFRVWLEQIQNVNEFITNPNFAYMITTSGGKTKVLIPLRDFLACELLLTERRGISQFTNEAAMSEAYQANKKIYDALGLKSIKIESLENPEEVFRNIAEADIIYTTRSINPFSYLSADKILANYEIYDKIYNLIGSRGGTTVIDEAHEILPGCYYTISIAGEEFKLIDKKFAAAGKAIDLAIQEVKGIYNRENPDRAIFMHNEHEVMIETYKEGKPIKPRYKSEFIEKIKEILRGKPKEWWIEEIGFTEEQYNNIRKELESGDIFNSNLEECRLLTDALQKRAWSLTKQKYGIDYGWGTRVVEGKEIRDTMPFMNYEPQPNMYFGHPSDSIAKRIISARMEIESKNPEMAIRDPVYYGKEIPYSLYDIKILGTRQLTTSMAKQITEGIKRGHKFILVSGTLESKARALQLATGIDTKRTVNLIEKYMESGEKAHWKKRIYITTKDEVLILKKEELNDVLKNKSGIVLILETEELHESEVVNIVKKAYNEQFKDEGWKLFIQNIQNIEIEKGTKGTFDLFDADGNLKLSVRDSDISEINRILREEGKIFFVISRKSKTGFDPKIPFRKLGFEEWVVTGEGITGKGTTIETFDQAFARVRGEYDWEKGEFVRDETGRRKYPDARIWYITDNPRDMTPEELLRRFEENAKLESERAVAFVLHDSLVNAGSANIRRAKEIAGREVRAILDRVENRYIEDVYLEGRLGDLEAKKFDLFMNEELDRISKLLSERCSELLSNKEFLDALERDPHGKEIRRLLEEGKNIRKKLGKFVVEYSKESRPISKSLYMAEDLAEWRDLVRESVARSELPEYSEQSFSPKLDIVEIVDIKGNCDRIRENISEIRERISRVNEEFGANEDLGKMERLRGDIGRLLDEFVRKRDIKSLNELRGSINEYKKEAGVLLHRMHKYAVEDREKEVMSNLESELRVIGDNISDGVIKLGQGLTAYEILRGRGIEDRGIESEREEIDTSIKEYEERERRIVKELERTREISEIEEGISKVKRELHRLYEEKEKLERRVEVPPEVEIPENVREKIEEIKGKISEIDEKIGDTNRRLERARKLMEKEKELREEKKNLQRELNELRKKIPTPPERLSETRYGFGWQGPQTLPAEHKREEDREIFREVSYDLVNKINHIWPAIFFKFKDDNLILARYRYVRLKVGGRVDFGGIIGLRDGRDVDNLGVYSTILEFLRESEEVMKGDVEKGGMGLYPISNEELLKKLKSEEGIHLEIEKDRPEYRDEEIIKLLVSRVLQGKKTVIKLDYIDREKASKTLSLLHECYERVRDIEPEKVKNFSFAFTPRLIMDTTISVIREPTGYREVHIDLDRDIITLADAEQKEDIEKYERVSRGGIRSRIGEIENKLKEIDEEIERIRDERTTEAQDEKLQNEKRKLEDEKKKLQKDLEELERIKEKPPKTEGISLKTELDRLNQLINRYEAERDKLEREARRRRELEEELANVRGKLTELMEKRKKALEVEAAPITPEEIGGKRKEKLEKEEHEEREVKVERVEREKKPEIKRGEKRLITEWRSLRREEIDRIGKDIKRGIKQEDIIGLIKTLENEELRESAVEVLKGIEKEYPFLSYRVFENIHKNISEEEKRKLAGLMPGFVMVERVSGENLDKWAKLVEDIHRYGVVRGTKQYIEKHYLRGLPEKDREKKMGEIMDKVSKGVLIILEPTPELMERIDSDRELRNKFTKETLDEIKNDITIKVNFEREYGTYKYAKGIILTDHSAPVDQTRRYEKEKYDSGKERLITDLGAITSKKNIKIVLREILDAKHGLDYEIKIPEIRDEIFEEISRDKEFRKYFERNLIQKEGKASLILRAYPIELREVEIVESKPEDIYKKFEGKGLGDIIPKPTYPEHVFAEKFISMDKLEDKIRDIAKLELTETFARIWNATGYIYTGTEDHIMVEIKDEKVKRLIITELSDVGDKRTLEKATCGEFIRHINKLITHEQRDEFYRRIARGLAESGMHKDEFIEFLKKAKKEAPEFSKDIDGVLKEIDNYYNVTYYKPKEVREGMIRSVRVAPETIHIEFVEEYGAKNLDKKEIREYLNLTEDEFKNLELLPEVQRIKINDRKFSPNEFITLYTIRKETGLSIPEIDEFLNRGLSVKFTLQSIDLANKICEEYKIDKSKLLSIALIAQEVRIENLGEEKDRIIEHSIKEFKEYEERKKRRLRRIEKKDVVIEAKDKERIGEIIGEEIQVEEKVIKTEEGEKRIKKAVISEPEIKEELLGRILDRIGEEPLKEEDVLKSIERDRVVVKIDNDYYEILPEKLSPEIEKKIDVIEDKLRDLGIEVERAEIKKFIKEIRSLPVNAELAIESINVAKEIKDKYKIERNLPEIAAQVYHEGIEISYPIPEKVRENAINRVIRNIEATSLPRIRISIPKIKITQESPLEINIKIRRHPITITEGDILKETKIDSSEEIEKLKESARKLRELPEIERIKEINRLVRETLRFPYIEEGLSEEEYKRRVKERDKKFGKIVNLSDIVRGGEGLCRHFVALYCVLAQEAGLKVAPQGGDVDNIMIMHPEEGERKLFKERALGARVPHAWVEVELSDGTWIPVDPTLNILGTEKEITESIFKNAYTESAYESIEISNLPEQLRYDKKHLIFSPGEKETTTSIYLYPRTYEEFELGEEKEVTVRRITEKEYSGSLDITLEGVLRLGGRTRESGVVVDGGRAEIVDVRARDVACEITYIEPRVGEGGAAPKEGVSREEFEGIEKELRNSYRILREMGIVSSSDEFNELCENKEVREILEDAKEGNLKLVLERLNIKSIDDFGRLCREEGIREVLWYAREENLRNVFMNCNVKTLEDFKEICKREEVRKVIRFSQEGNLKLVLERLNIASVEDFVKLGKIEVIKTLEDSKENNLKLIMERCNIKTVEEFEEICRIEQVREILTYAKEENLKLALDLYGVKNKGEFEEICSREEVRLVLIGAKENNLKLIMERCNIKSWEEFEEICKIEHAERALAAKEENLKLALDLYKVKDIGDFENICKNWDVVLVLSYAKENNLKLIMERCNIKSWEEFEEICSEWEVREVLRNAREENLELSLKFFKIGNIKMFKEFCREENIAEILSTTEKEELIEVLRRMERGVRKTEPRKKKVTLRREFIEDVGRVLPHLSKKITEDDIEDLASI
ncbi:MAG: hypothetical protein DRO95_03810, partial [Candidatus Altiarchaeales archaeon]